MILTATTTRWLGVLVAGCLVCQSRAALKLPETDQRLQVPRTLNTPRSFPPIDSKAAWERRAHDLREQILVSCGLWPMPEKSPLQPHIFDKVERDGYSVEKVYLQTYRGFYLGGNLYRPLGKGSGPFPGILNPHGHWREGRLEDGPSGSIAARCINFAKQGMIAFAYDMVGYNDTSQLGPHRQFATHPTNLLWNISLMGLQTWNSIRALDFLESLPDVDQQRLACTGASGGGTQTFMLGAVEDRLAAQAPCVMVSHSMQGGCLCENAPGLRVDYSNMEIAAVPAPRPQILVAATGDWTRTTMTLEGPAIEKIYQLFDARDHLRYVRFEFDHNYNQTTREAVYQWFDRWLLHQPDAASVREVAYQKEPNEALRVFPDGKYPGNAKTEDQLIEMLIESAKAQLEALRPRNKRGFEHYKDVLLPAWRHTLQVELPEKRLVVEAQPVEKRGSLTFTRLHVGREGRGDRLPVLMISPEKDQWRYIAVLAHPKGQAGFLNDQGSPAGLARELLERNYTVVLVDTFLTGALADSRIEKSRNPFADYFPTYNRTDLQERVQDLITTCAFAQAHGKGRQVILCGSGRAGLWALLAAPAAHAVVADCAGLNPDDDAVIMEKDLFLPGIHRIGGFSGTAGLAAPHPLLLHHTGRSFSTDWLRDCYASVRSAKFFKTESGQLEDAAIADWIVAIKSGQ